MELCFEDWVILACSGRSHSSLLLDGVGLAVNILRALSAIRRFMLVKVMASMGSFLILAGSMEQVENVIKRVRDSFFFK